MNQEEIDYANQWHKKIKERNENNVKKTDNIKSNLFYILLFIGIIIFIIVLIYILIRAYKTEEPEDILDEIGRICKAEEIESLV